MGKISLQHLKKTYDQKNYAVEDFSLDIEDGEFIVLVGPSGCGKTTTLRMIAGLESISSGQLLIDGVKANNKLPKDRDLAMVFQNYALYPHKTVYENMAYPLELRKLSKEETKAKVLQAARLLSIEDQLDKKPGQLSGGQKQRVALGRCMVRTPKAFLMDEPLSNLDAKLRVQMRSEIVQLQKKLHKTFIYVTHDQTEAMTMGDRIVVMKDGKIMQIASATEIYAEPANRFVAEFIGNPPMNILSFSDEVLHFNDTQLGSGTHSLDLGFRPEKVSCHKKGQDIQFEAMVDHIEPLGAENHVFISLNGKQVVIRDFELTPLKEKQSHTFYLDLADLYYFDQQSGQRLSSIH
ncbi:sn-glycerol-3-phosphate ABC transporter ATP-binding protein UgpC [Atopobacter sp. AH10]|uniref:ABC transporter ATP-binding protein n=1 Tax=Atopobacter sp. AH10 TaxID=2315861 RepID=UPI000EF191C9|nr:sn-glycerol-3-phosphate ABC transporter ATP-binding protein UgpC [Atopobacter sp. AH10]RLK63375.1 sn-glycerol-3-phosphate ABC transporter ATP-binding protein UgpC [Atopobacter sp. AH10]